MTQIEQFSEKLNHNYHLYKESSLKNRRIKHQNILPLIQKVSKTTAFEMKILGNSVEGRTIYALSAGTGKTKVLLWSQMHGNEPTATQALFDIFNFFNNPQELASEAQNILDNLDLHFIPMLNPDGTEVFKRRNALNIDLNRDALRQIAPETNILKKYRDGLFPDFAFNLHDQNPYYTAGATNKPATLSFLAPAYNYEKDIDEKRKNSMQVIGIMNTILQKLIPGQVGRYFDAYGPTSMGDNMQKWGTRTILIESGEYDPFNDAERQYVRKLNFIAILSGLLAIANNSYTNIEQDEYWKIPEINDAKMFHILIRNAQIYKSGQYYKTDIGIHINEEPTDNSFLRQSEVYELGDLSFYHAYKEFDADGAVVKDFDNNNLVLNIGDNADFILEKDNNPLLKLRNGNIA
ncbi:MAG: hypothetical protein L3J74_01200 [Bacteroidales bacterium]|nr:hypothetical protein [Bacteroidales bacterium]